MDNYRVFLRFTISGDDLNLEQIRNDITVESKIFVKGSLVEYNFPRKNYKPKYQKTNRWVFSLESSGSKSLNDVIKRMYGCLKNSMADIARYSAKYHSLLDIVVYVNSEKPISKYNTVLSKSSLKIISKLNTKLSLTVFDW